MLCAGLLICSCVSVQGEAAYFQVPALTTWQSTSTAPLTPMVVRPEAMHNSLLPSLPLSSPVVEADAEVSRFGWSAPVAVMAAAVIILSGRAAVSSHSSEKRSTAEELLDG